MKKLFTLALVVLGLAACQNEPEGLDVNLGEEQLVTVSVALPEGTRVASDTGADLATIAGTSDEYQIRYILEVYHNGVGKAQQIKCLDAQSAAFDVRLAPGRKYTFVVWADIVKDSVSPYYNVPDHNNGGLANISLKDGVWKSDDNLRDAYTITKEVDFNGSAINLTLTRPFAKVRVITTDYDDLAKVGIVPAKATVAYKDVYKAYNAVAGAPIETSKADVTLTGFGIFDYDDATGENTIFADYLFAKNEEAVVEFSLDVMEANDNRVKFNNFNTSIPVKRNTVTTIKGDVLTENGKINVGIDGVFTTPGTEVKVANNAADLQEIINNAPAGEETNITLGGDIDLGDLFAGILSTRAAATLPIVIPEGKVVALDLNGYKITTPWENQSAEKHYYAFENHGSLTIQDSSEGKTGEIIARGIFNYGTMTLESGKINACDHNGGYGVRNYEGAEFIMNGGSIVTSNEDGDEPGVGYDACPVRVDEGATATINGGNITNVSNYTVAIDNYGTTTINDGTFTTIHTTIANSASMTINGGSFTCNGLEGITAHALWAAEGTTTINGGIFDGKDNYNGFNVDASKDAIVNINGGKFLPVHSGSLYGEGTINVMGGEFFDDPSARVAAGYKAVDNGNGTWSVAQYTPFSELVEKVKAANGTYVGQGETYTIMPTSGDAREQGVAATVPNRLQKYSNPEVYYAQYQLFAELSDVNISNVKIEFIPAAITVKDAWNTAGATTTKDNVNGEVQFMNSGKVTLTDCVFNTVSVSPINAPQLAVSGCEFNELKAYAIKDVKAGVVNISNNEFNNCNGGFWFNAAPENVVANGNIFSVGRRGAIQFSANGDYTNTVIDITGNRVVGALLWQLNETLPYQAYKTIIENNTYTTACVDGSFIPEPEVAKIGEVGYTSLQKAVNAAQNGDTVLFVADIEQEDGVIITDKNITIDLNGNQFTVSNGASTKNRNFKVNGSSAVTIKNGTMVAAGNYSSGAYGTLRTEGTANVTLEDVKLYNYRGNGLNVKALSGTTVTINDTEIYSQYGGGVEAAGGTVELTNVKIEQEGMYTAPYNSMAISVNGGGTATVNSGTYSTECLTAEEANNQGTSHGPWCAGVLNSGGTLIIKGGTFSNDNFGDNLLATYARGLLLADTAANIQIEGGVFNAVKAIIDMTNNLGDASRNPSATISGGVFSADPLISGLYASHLISVADGYKVVKDENGTWTVIAE